MAQVEAIPTPLTPAWVPVNDPKTGLINQAWYLFFLSLFEAAKVTYENQLTGPSAISLVASLEAALERLTQELQAQPSNEPGELQQQINTLTQFANLAVNGQVGELQQQINTLRQELQTQRQPELGSLSPLEQDNVPWLTFNIAPSPVPTAVGSMYWDGGTTMGLQASTNVLIRIGESEFVYVKASSAITKGQVCYHTGAVGASGVITTAPSPLSLSDPNQIVGVAAEDIALNGFGLIQISGVLRGFNTTGSSVGEVWADGDPLYYNPDYVGSFTKTKPSAPKQKTFMGEVINAGSGASGSINIRIVPGSVLGGTDSNVQFGTLANKDIIQYDSTLGYWKNVAASNSATACSNITVGASPFTYQNTTAYPADVIVSGGTVTLLEFTRDNATFYDTGSYYGMFTLSPNDRLRVTYTAAPTMTFVPR